MVGEEEIKGGIFFLLFGDEVKVKSKVLPRGVD